MLTLLMIRNDPPVSVSEPQKDLNARCLKMKEIDHNPGEESKDQKVWEMEEPADAFEDLDDGLNDNNDEVHPEEGSETTVKGLSYSSYSTCVDAVVYCEAPVKSPRMFSENVRLLSEGTFIQNPGEIFEKHDKFPDTKVTGKEVTQLERHDFSPENHVANNKNIREEVGDDLKQDKATKDVEKGIDDLKLSKLAKNLKDTMGLDDSNAHKARDKS